MLGTTALNISRNTWQPSRGFKGVRDSLFTAPHMEASDGMEYDDIDDQADFFSRRSRRIIQTEKAFNLPQPTQFESRRLLS